MACEMQQMKLKGLEGGLSYDDPEMQAIRDYCLKHALVFFYLKSLV